MKKHITYETELNTIALETNLKAFKGENINYKSFDDFFKAIYNEYQNLLDHRNDLFFSTYVNLHIFSKPSESKLQISCCFSH